MTHTYRVIWAGSVFRTGSVSTFRTYQAPSSQVPTEITLVDAICSTLSRPGLFQPFPVGEGFERDSFAGPPIGHYNPTSLLLREVQLIYGLRKRISAVLSVGTGPSPPHSMNDNTTQQDIIHALRDVAACVMNDPQTLAEILAHQTFPSTCYLRLNVQYGMAAIQQSDWHMFSSIKMHTVAYLTTYVTHVASAVTANQNSTSFLPIGAFCEYNTSMWFVSSRSDTFVQRLPQET
jgi:hypothetical protein